MIGYDVKTRQEAWFVAGMPAGLCTSPMVAIGKLFFAGLKLFPPSTEAMTSPRPIGAALQPSAQ
jgi:hypothetical protein